ncbi:MAG: hypothetical protein PHS73_03045, partial [Candidatus Peribacteraceae bacterium]|nr:hypothetical protein [Candidatus Peribacteraceae bacterium]
VVCHCHAAGKLDFPDEAPFTLIESYATNGKPIQAAPLAVSPAPAASPPSPHPEPSAPPLPPENTQPVAAATRRHPPKAPAKIDPEPEQTEEQKRQRRFCRWVREEYGILVDQYQFEEAVDHMTEKFQSLAKGAANRLKIPATYRGEKKTIRKEALRLLPLRIREFDPLSGQHFNQFVSDWLDQKLQEFVGKK